jgi:hypothetical protein
MELFDQSANIMFDIMWFWDNTDAIENFLLKCRLTPIKSKIVEFSQEVVNTNAEYYNRIKKCFTIADDVIYNNNYKCDLTFFETAIVRLLLSKKINSNFDIFDQAPEFVKDFKKLFKENHHGNKTIRRIKIS